MQQFDYDKYRKNNPLLKEAKQSRLKESYDPLDAMRQAFMILTDLQDELKSMKASGNIPDGESIIDRALAVFDEIEALENDDMSTAEPIKEYTKDSGPEMQELLKALKDIQEKNKEIKAVGVKTLEKMITDLE
ncbi:MAG: hypothetical protein EBZ47_07985, partial [Chlamydiae bacterium]|nr:hypothetical protein [Chlamydiota bacterium]